MSGAGPVSKDPSEASKEAVEAVLADMARAGDGDRGVIVDSPPGAGKTTLVVRAARALVESGEPAMIIAQTNHQIDDLLERLSAELPDVRLGRLSAETYLPPDAVRSLPNVAIDTRIDGLADRVDVLGLFVGDLHTELVFERHEQLYYTERVDFEVLLERGVVGDLVGVQAELRHQHFLKTLRNLGAIHLLFLSLSSG